MENSLLLFWFAAKKRLFPFSAFDRSSSLFCCFPFGHSRILLCSYFWPWIKWAAMNIASGPFVSTAHIYVWKEPFMKRRKRLSAVRSHPLILCYFLHRFRRKKKTKKKSLYSISLSCVREESHLREREREMANFSFYSFFFLFRYVRPAASLRFFYFLDRESRLVWLGVTYKKPFFVSSINEKAF